MFFIQFGIVLLCILVGARIGGIGLGVMGGLGLAILSFGFGLKPAGLPIDVMFMIRQSSLPPQRCKRQAV